MKWAKPDTLFITENPFKLWVYRGRLTDRDGVMLEQNQLNDDMTEITYVRIEVDIEVFVSKFKEIGVL